MCSTKEPTTRLLSSTIAVANRINCIWSDLILIPLSSYRWLTLLTQTGTKTPTGVRCLANGQHLSPSTSPFCFPYFLLVTVYLFLFDLPRFLPSLWGSLAVPPFSGNGLAPRGSHVATVRFLVAQADEIAPRQKSVASSSSKKRLVTSQLAETEKGTRTIPCRFEYPEWRHSWRNLWATLQ